MSILYVVLSVANYSHVAHVHVVPYNNDTLQQWMELEDRAIDPVESGMNALLMLLACYTGLGRDTVNSLLTDTSTQSLYCI